MTRSPLPLVALTALTLIACGGGGGRLGATFRRASVPVTRYVDRQCAST